MADSARRRRCRVRKFALIGVTLAALALPGSALAAAGDLDPTFSGDGIAVKPGEYDGMAVDSQGRVVVLSGFERTVSRFLPNGTLDHSFSGDGTAAVPYDAALGDSAYTNAVAVDSHDRIVVAGRAGAQFVVGRLTVNGSPDRSFSDDGYTLTKIRTHAEAWTVEVDPQGRIVAAGSAFGRGQGYVALARYLPNGALDTSFSGDGKQHTQFADVINGPARAVAFDSKGRIVVAGTATKPTDYHGVFIVARYTHAGGLDPTFSDDGMLTTRIGPGGPFGEVGLAVDDSNRIVFAGDDEPGNGDRTRLAIARLRVNGAFDPSFSGDGKVLTSFGLDFNRANGVAIDHAQRVVAVGTTGNSRSPSSFAIARYTPSGSLDPAFSGDGRVTTSIAHFSIAHDAAIDSSGNIVVGGELQSGDPRHSNVRIALARYMSG